MEDKQQSFTDEDIQKMLKMVRSDLCKKCFSPNIKIVNDEHYMDCGAECHRVDYQCNDCGAEWVVLEHGALNPRLAHEKYGLPMNSDFAIIFG